MSTGTSCIVEQFGLAMMPSWPSRSSGLTCADDERDRRVHAPRGRVVDDRRAARGGLRARARGRRRRRPRRGRCRRRRRPRRPPRRSRASGRRSTTVRPADRPDASRRSSPTGNSRSLRTWIIVRPTTPVAPTTATVRGWRVMSGMAPRGHCHWSGHGGSIAAARFAGRRRPGSSRLSTRIERAASIGQLAATSGQSERLSRATGSTRPANRRAWSGGGSSATGDSRSLIQLFRSAKRGIQSTHVARQGRCPAVERPPNRRAAGGAGGSDLASARSASAQTGSLARWRCMAALRDRLTRPWRSISVTTTMTSSPTDTTSSTVGTW